MTDLIASRAVHAPSADADADGVARPGPARAFPAVVGAVAIAVAYAWIAGGSSLWDVDEPRFARAAVEMVESGNWLYPTFNGALRPDKPILVYWLMAPLVRLFGPGEVAVRLWSAIGVAAAAVIAGGIARRMVGAQAATWTMAILATAPLALVCGTAATTDGVLLALVTGAIAVGLAGFRRPDPALLAGFALLIAAGLLLKGPIGLAAPGIALGAIRWSGRGRVAVPGSGRRLALAAFAGCLGFLAWGIPADAATGGEYARIGIGRHVVARAFEPLESHGGHWLLFLPYYLVVVIAAFFPWTLFLPAAIAHLRRGDQALRAVLGGWALGILGLITAVVTKLPHYALPAFVPLAIATAAVVTADDPASEPATRRALARGRWLLIGVGVVLAAGLAGAPWSRPEVARLRMPGLVAALVVAAMCWRAAAAIGSGDRRAAARGLAIGMLALVAVLRVGVLPALETAKPSPSLAEAIRAASPPSAAVAACGWSSPSLVFYLDRPVERLADEAAARAWLAQEGPRVLVVEAARAPALAAAAPPGARLVADLVGFDHDHGRAVRLVAWLRD